MICVKRIGFMPSRYAFYVHFLNILDGATPVVKEKAYVALTE